MQHWPHLPRRLQSARVLVRFGVRLLVLVAFAGFGSIGLNQSLMALFWMATVLCAVIAGIRRERFLDHDLNHWDEMAAYGAPCALKTWSTLAVLGPPRRSRTAHKVGFRTIGPDRLVAEQGQQAG